MYKKGLLIVISGPSGTGKGTICAALTKNTPDIELSVSCTTREPRPGEVDGVNYFFKTEEEFDRLIKEGMLLEHAKVFDHYYGTPLKYVEDKLESGYNVLLEIDVQGAMKVKEKYRQGIYVFLAPPSLKELERRIRSRGTETDEQIKKRLAKAGTEIGYMSKYDYVIVNDVIKTVVDKIKCILCAEKQTVARNRDLEKSIMSGEEIE
jgi:guanylate kinase